ncbi:Fpg/Nei family DNA glycosylase [Planctomonas psychrotolerans]|uniref:Fpg/Nei family DNA glycosylase n=1 Tax=Planctomonas psychrotolerans TaxID=2528712 RepID=UPI001239D18A|nr:DNA-formamidopyrimidine glycosylase family protein [Planctomonas psychrotolerans]
MPEGHSIHRIARQFGEHFAGHRVEASSPQGRFAEGAERLSGAVLVRAFAVGKQLFIEFDSGLWLRVHLGLYGAWDFAGSVSTSSRRYGQTGMRGNIPIDTAAEDSLSSIGAPRRTRLRMAEQEQLHDTFEAWPPDPIGAVRLRLLTEDAVADLRGPTACEVLTADLVEVAIAKLGPDPLVHGGKRSEDRFTATVRKKSTPIGLLLMDQSVVSGIGNVYRAELLFRARLNPHTPGNRVSEEAARGLWRDWTKLLRKGVEVGQMLTMDGLRGARLDAALASRDDRHWVYKREGLPCRVCGTHIVMEPMGGRKLYWCPQDQA